MGHHLYCLTLELPHPSPHKSSERQATLHGCALPIAPALAPGRDPNFGGGLPWGCPSLTPVTGPKPRAGQSVRPRHRTGRGGRAMRGGGVSGSGGGGGGGGGQYGPETGPNGPGLRPGGFRQDPCYFVADWACMAPQHPTAHLPSPVLGDFGAFGVQLGARPQNQKKWPDRGPDGPNRDS